MAQQTLEQQAERILVAVEAIIRVLATDKTRIDQELTKPQLLTLLSLARKRCCTMTELGKLTGYATSALTGIVDRMARKKFVQRVRDDVDRRVINVVITEKGLDTATVFHQFSVRSTMAALEKVDEEEREKFVRLFEKIASGFTGQG